MKITNTGRIRNIAFTIGAVLTVAASGSTAGAMTNAVADDVMDTLYTMRSAYRSSYAPADWKKKQFGYDLEAEFKKAVQAVQAKPDLTVAEARPIFKDFIYSMKDYHTSISFASTEKAVLPFTVKNVGDRYFIMHIDRVKLSEKAFPFKVGDELITFDGKPVKEAIADIEDNTGDNVPETDRSVAALRLTTREASRGYLKIPQGPLVVGVQKKGSSTVQNLQLLWDYTPEKIGPRVNWSTTFNRESSNLLLPKMDVDIATNSPNLDNPYDLGAKQTFTPDLGLKIWEAPKENEFYAYIYKAPNGRLVGYLRLPRYTMKDYNKSVKDFETVIKHFESLTDALVIDQVNNPGGSVFYLYALVGMLADQPMQTPRHMMTITQEDVADAANLAEKFKDVKNDEDAVKALAGEDMHGYPITYQTAQFAINYANFFVSEWNAGHKRTAPYWIGGVDQINPNPTHYTKPILVLVNNLCFSGGDFFPGTLQDNKRAVIMGSRTAGAGGYVRSVKVPNNVGIVQFRTTGSLAERVQGNPLENLGVTPDVPYEMTVDDMQDNYKPYVKAVNEQVVKMIK